MTGISTSNEAQIAAMLNIYEYLDYHMGRPGMTFRELVNEAEKYLDNNPMLGDRTEMLNILKDGVDHIPGLADLRLSMSDHGRGIEADAFVGDGNQAYVVYRGTGDRKWIDNGRGMTAEMTTSQQQASDFYDRVVRQCHLNEDTELIVTGHSKGGNNAQTATLNAKNRSLIDRCYSFDGEGMSDAAVKRYSQMPGFDEQRKKMYSINNENDAVNEFGLKVIPDENTVYIKTNTDDSDLVSTHSVEYLFHRGDGSYGYTMNEETSQGPIGQYAHKLSDILMHMPEDIRGDCAVSIMQIVEMAEGDWKGFDGDHASFTELSTFMHMGIPMLFYSLLGTEEGREALFDILQDMVIHSVEEKGVWATAATIVATVMVSVLVVPVALDALTWVIDRLAALERIGEILQQIGEYIEECLEAIGEFFSQISAWIRSKISGRPIIESADFSVNIDALRFSADELENMQRALQTASSRVNSVKRSLPIYGLVGSAVKMHLNYVSFNVIQVSGRAGAMGRVLDNTADTYVQYELGIAGNVGA